MNFRQFRCHNHLIPAALLLLGTMACARAATYTWDGNNGNSGSQTNWSTAGNWNPNGAPSSGAGNDLVFTTSDKTTNNADGGNWTINSLSFDSNAGAFTLGGSGLNIGAGGITNSSTGTQTIGNQITLSANQTWNASSGAIIANGYVGGNGKNLTLDGSSAITLNNQLNGVGTVTTSGSGNRTFNGYTSAANFSIGGSGTTTFNGELNATSGITVTGGGNVNFTGQIDHGTLTLNGTGTTTLSGNSSKNISSTVVNSGTLVMDQTGGGDAINGSLTVNNGGTVEFQGNNQVPSWQTVTLNTGSTLLLGDTTQAFTNLVITGDSIIDFGGGGSVLNLSSVTVTNNAILTIVNWNSAVDLFTSSGNASSQAVQVYYADTGTTGTYTPGSGTITPSAPVPEPGTYGLVLTGSSIALVLGLRRRQSPRQA
ncbi:MAG: PEP-CTERM sorting domain-containing protein [Opitutaceae bacterium]